ncbi:dienelactone hydrolase family protein [Saccharothrix sp. S26]|uniref:dienelactone hydrolase family protein n=1 Tax=Saccharothrix sp. S26 TaxID=2907215 RepID=UPI001F165E17|nr:dienelactone hydrolase family protein [Saccharothrix sp. S26]MCE6993732.1 dienelactone hydrolase family protein [Saccharothrix sp. S26]
MAEVVLFHHAHGVTPGVEVFAERLAAAGHTVHVPDLFEGRIFVDLGDGLDYVGEVGFATIAERGRLAAEGLPAGVVYAGFSLGVLPAQMLAQTKPGAAGALLVSACVPVSEFGPWPAGVPVQVHAMADDASFVRDGDIDAARDLVAGAADGELFLYPGDKHLFADESLSTYDEVAAALFMERVLAFLN